MDILAKEEKLFAAWKQKYAEIYPNETFVVDGAPCPASYESSPAKCLIVLKDANFAPQTIPDKTFDLRRQLASEEPHSWWRRISNWCTGISRIHENLSWCEFQHDDADKNRIRQSLKPFAFMQLKKTVGGASISDKNLWAHAKRDETEIRIQIDIYQPTVIICCGSAVWSSLVAMFRNPESKQTRNGVQYAAMDVNGKRTFLINYMHPSVRASENIICYGILDAYREIVMSNSAT